ncbi:MAG TPA: serine/threonine-protein kinase [Hyalangium sp.]|nr:serine/threonine-protein kinase [Hyalangium sp.]
MTNRPTPDWLVPGDLVGPWRIEGYAGRGAYGVVFRARRAGHPSAGPVALKVAQSAEDPRFEREVGLLSRVQHPSLPQLLDRGWWTSSTGAVHPYVVIEWIRGQTLYEWGQRHNPTSRQVMKVVAQLAWGLEVVHRAEGLHRDVRGDNTLVEPEGRAVLTDFGSCTWRGAAPLTERVMPPNTREYRSPEALLFEWKNWGNKSARYEAQASDDLYALAVSTYRLVTGVYPPPAVTELEPQKDSPHALPPKRLPPQALNHRVVQKLADLLERMLAEDPRARESAREIALAADSAALHAGPEADVPLFDLPAADVAAPVCAGSKAHSDRAAAEELEAMPAAMSAGYLPSPSARKAAIAAAMAFAVLALCQGADEPYAQAQEVAWVEAQGTDEAPDGGTKGLGEEVASARVDAEGPPVHAWVAITKPVPDQPLPGQRRSPCPRNVEVVIKGGCWKHQPDIRPPCGDYYEWQSACYLPIMGQTRVPTTQEP